MGQAQPDVSIAQEQLLSGRQQSGNKIRIYSVLYKGWLMATDPNQFKLTMAT
jgi:hypothetical protein